MMTFDIMYRQIKCFLLKQGTIVFCTVREKMNQDFSECSQSFGAGPKQSLSQSANSMPGILIDIDDFAKILACSTRHVRRLVDRGRIPQPVKLGALLRWVKTDVDKWIAAGCPNCRKGVGR